MFPLTFDRRRITPAAVKTAVRDAAIITVGVAALLLIASLLDPHTVDIVRSALEADSKAPPNAAVIEKGLATIQGNWYWFLLVTFPLAITVLLGAVALGVRSASDWMFKLVLGIVGVIAFAPALVA